MYYRLTIDLSEVNVSIEQESHIELDLYGGEAIRDPIDAPVEFSVEIDEDEDGTPESPNLFAYFPDASLMTRDLVAALESLGVDNIQALPARLVCEGTGQVIDDYVAVNVVGLVSCADMSQSAAEPLADAHYFEALVVDESRTGDIPLFRLAESQMEILLRRDVAEAISSQSFPGLVFEPLASTPG